MTKQEYIKIANAIMATRQKYLLPQIAIDTCAREIALELAKDNPRFNEAKFLAACGNPPPNP